VQHRANKALFLKSILTFKRTAMGLDISVIKIHVDQEDQNKTEEEIYNTKPGEEILYYRKVNFLVPFFEDSVLQEEVGFILSSVYKYKVKDLIDSCEKVLKNRKKASEILPTEEGFFFGSTEYDDYYFECVQEVLNNFKELLKDFEEDCKYYIIFDY